MIDGGAAAFLQQAHRNNWHQYLASLQENARRGWDLCILTASDERQAAMYRRQLDWRHEAGVLPARTRFLVLADPDGKRIGSGGATLRALWQVQTARLQAAGGDATPVAGLQTAALDRILIIHSGGDSRRLPHCSAVGKLFARVPRELPDGRASTIFDEFLIGLSGLAAELPAGVLVASGDVLLVFDALQLRGAFSREGVIGVAAAAPVETGTHHGVYASEGGGRHSVRAYLHKPSLGELSRWNAVAGDDTVQIDTGLVWFDALTAARLARLTEEPAVAALMGAEGLELRSSAETANLQPGGFQSTGLNLYGDLLLPLAVSTTLSSYLADTSDGPATPPVQAARRVIWEQLRGTPFSVERLQPAIFEHFGTSQEYWHMVAGDPELARLCGWNVPVGEQGGAIWINAVADAHPALGLSQGASGQRAALIVDSRLAGPFTVSGTAIIANVETGLSFHLGADLVLHQLPLAEGYVTRLYGMRDDPKRAVNDPGATFLNGPWRNWLGNDGELIAAVWPNCNPSERTLWNARLFPVARERDESLRLALPLQDVRCAPDDWRGRWLASPRLSLAESFRQADGGRILMEAAEIEDLVAGDRFYLAVETEQPAGQAKALLGKVPRATVRRAEQVGQRLAGADPILQLRGFVAIAEATGDSSWEDRAFDTLASMIERSTLHLPRANASGAGTRLSGMPHADVQRIHAAARIDFGGGWTDTPPYSIERGGTVLNAAVTLRGRYPILAETEDLSEPGIILDSRDIEATLEPLTAGEVLAYADPTDPFALLKAALVLRGIVPPDADPAQPLADLLRESGGLRVSTQTFIPRGSGLGTSSIVAGAVLMALARWLGITLSEAQLFDEVLCLEQMLTTGGGWQDQVGGLTGGIKLVTTSPGLPQVIRVEPVRLSPDTACELAQRLLLIYTGQQRLAKNLLRNVMGRWMARDLEMVWIQEEIARLAVAMRTALKAGDVTQFGALLGEHWTLNKRMDPGCTNLFINDLFEAMAPYIDGGKLAGAGGGGYAMVIARNGRAAADLTTLLTVRYHGTMAALWPCDIPDEGLRVG